MNSAVTVLVPLHRSMPFVDVVEANVRRLARHCVVVVSDATAADDALAQLRRRLTDVDVTWLGERPIQPGWISHYNDLLGRVSTDRFMWLPHDDEIDPGYVERCSAALDADPELAGAVGMIEPIVGPGLFHVDQHHLADVDHDEPFVSEANRLVLRWNPGIAFRAVWRTTAVEPIEPTDAGSAWADVVWVYGVALRHRIVQVSDAPYRKRFYDTSTHAGWTVPLFPTALPHLLRQVDGAGDAPTRSAVAVELVTGAVHVVLAHQRARQAAHEAELGRLADEYAEVRAEIDRLRVSAGAAEQARALAEAEIEAVRTAWSWRIGQLVLAPVRWLRRTASLRP